MKENKFLYSSQCIVNKTIANRPRKYVLFYSYLLSISYNSNCIRITIENKRKLKRGWKRDKVEKGKGS